MSCSHPGMDDSTIAFGHRSKTKSCISSEELVGIFDACEHLTLDFFLPLGLSDILRLSSFFLKFFLDVELLCLSIDETCEFSGRSCRGENTLSAL